MARTRHVLASALAFALAGGIAGTTAQAASPFNAAVATFEQTDTSGLWGVNLAIDGNSNGVFNGTTPNAWSIHSPSNPSGESLAQTAYFRFASPLQLTAGSPQLAISLIQMFDPTQQSTIISTKFHTLGNFRISATTADLSSFTLGNAAAASWTALDPISLTFSVPSGPVPTYSVDATKAVLINSPGPALATYNFLAAPGLINITGLRLEVLEHSGLPTNGPGFAANGNFALTEIDARAVPEPATLSLLAIAGTGLLFRRRRSV